MTALDPEVTPTMPPRPTLNFSPSPFWIAIIIAVGCVLSGSFIVLMVIVSSFFTLTLTKSTGAVILLLVLTLGIFAVAILWFGRKSLWQTEEKEREREKERQERKSAEVTVVLAAPPTQQVVMVNAKKGPSGLKAFVSIFIVFAFLVGFALLVLYNPGGPSHLPPWPWW